MTRHRKNQRRRSTFYFLLTAAFALVIGATTLSSMRVHALTGAYEASAVLGQTGYTNSSTNAGGSVSASSMDFPITAVVDTVHHRLFVADNSNSRVMVYSLDNNNNLTGTSATYVIGQASLTVNGANGGQNGLSNPEGLAYDADDNLLFVSDDNASRVLVFNTATISDNMNASYVLGQSSYSGSTGTTTQTGLAYPMGLAYDSPDHLLFVADSNNNRVVAYNTKALSTGMNASYVLGQGTSYTAKATALTQAGESNPTGVAYDPTDKLVFVADEANRRVLAYSTASLTSGENASYVIGQSGFTTAAAATTQAGAGAPYSLAYDSTDDMLFVSDPYSSRVTGYNVGSISNGMNASVVIGQSNFTSGTGVNASTQSAFDGTSTQTSPMGLGFDPSNHRLYIADTLNNRVIVDDLVNVTTSSTLPAASVGSTYSTSFAASDSQGTVSYAVTSGALPAGLSLNGTTGTISGTPTSAGTYNFEITATDALGTAGSFVDDPAYSITVGSASSVGAPDTGFGVFTASPLRTLTEFGIAAIGLFGIAATIRKFAKR